MEEEREAVKTANNNKKPRGKPFEKDDPRINRDGRPEGSVSVVEAIKRKLKEVPEGKKKTYLEFLTDQIFKKAVIEGDVAMIKDLIDRVDGKPKQPLVGGDGGALVVKVISYGNNDPFQLVSRDSSTTNSTEA